MNRSDIVLGGVILVILFAGFLLLRNQDPVDPAVVPTPTPSQSIESKIESTFNVAIPDDIEKAELQDVSGGDASAVATRKFENNIFEFSILADLPDPQSGSFYSAWLGNNNDYHYLGRLSIAKGGYSLEYTVDHDHSEFNQVIVSQESADVSVPTKRVLQGDF